MLPVQAVEIRLPWPCREVCPSNKAHCVPGEHRVVEDGSKLAVVVSSPVQTGVIAGHRQAVNLHRSSMEFHGRLTGAFRFDVSGRNVNSTAGAARHGVAVVDFERRKGGLLSARWMLSSRRSTEFTAKMP